MELDGMTCLVTGANRGIGLAVARRLAKEPVRLLVELREINRYEPIEPEGAVEIKRILLAIKSDDETLGPGGKSALGKLASHLPRWILDTTASHSFERQPAERGA